MNRWSKRRFPGIKAFLLAGLCWLVIAEAGVARGTITTVVIEDDSGMSNVAMDISEAMADLFPASASVRHLSSNDGARVCSTWSLPGERLQTAMNNSCGAADSCAILMAANTGVSNHRNPFIAGEDMVIFRNSVAQAATPDHYLYSIGVTTGNFGPPPAWRTINENNAALLSSATHPFDHNPGNIMPNGVYDDVNAIAAGIADAISQIY